MFWEWRPWRLLTVGHTLLRNSWWLQKWHFLCMTFQYLFAKYVRLLMEALEGHDIYSPCEHERVKLSHWMCYWPPRQVDTDGRDSCSSLYIQQPLRLFVCYFKWWFAFCGVLAPFKWQFAFLVISLLYLMICLLGDCLAPFNWQQFAFLVISLLYLTICLLGDCLAPFNWQRFAIWVIILFHLTDDYLPFMWSACSF